MSHRKEMSLKKSPRIKRIANIERLRILAAICVASFHIHYSFPRSIGVIGFIILMLSFSVFVVNKSEKYDVSDQMKRKAQRLLKPWLFWSGVYGALGLMKVIYTSVPFSDVFYVTMFLTGTRLHLWFLPFAFVATLFLALLHQLTIRMSKAVDIMASSLVGALCVLGCSIIRSRAELQTPVEQWILGVPAIPIGFAIGYSMLLEKAHERRNCYLWITIMMIVTSVILTFLGYSNIFAINYCVSVALVCCALYWRGELDLISSKLASLSFGIYLIHPLVVTFFNHLALAQQQHPVMLLFLVVSISALITFVLKRTPARQFV